MLNNILNLEGVKVLNKQEQETINEGQKCETISISNTPFGTYNGGVYSTHTITYRCRPTILGIGVGS